MRRCRALGLARLARSSRPGAAGARRGWGGGFCRFGVAVRVGLGGGGRGTRAADRGRRSFSVVYDRAPAPPRARVQGERRSAPVQSPPRTRGTRGCPGAVIVCRGRAHFNVRNVARVGISHAVPPAPPPLAPPPVPLPRSSHPTPSSPAPPPAPSDIVIDSARPPDVRTSSTPRASFTPQSPHARPVTPPATPPVGVS